MWFWGSWVEQIILLAGNWLKVSTWVETGLKFIWLGGNGLKTLSYFREMDGICWIYFKPLNSYKYIYIFIHSYTQIKNWWTPLDARQLPKHRPGPAFKSMSCFACWAASSGEITSGSSSTSQCGLLHLWYCRYIQNVYADVYVYIYIDMKQVYYIIYICVCVQCICIYIYS